MTTIGSGAASLYSASGAAPSAASRTTFSNVLPDTLTEGGEERYAVFKGLDRRSSSVKRTWELPDDVYQRVVDGMQATLEADYRQFPEKPDFSNYPGTQSFASVIVDGKVVATIDNQGDVSTDIPLGHMLMDTYNGTNGPDLAKALAEQIAQYLAGKVMTSDTAITQSEFDALPPFEVPKPTVNFEAMIADARYTGLQELQRMRQDYLAQKRPLTDVSV